jgi:hypothetical protein
VWLFVTGLARWATAEAENAISLFEQAQASGNAHALKGRACLHPLCQRSLGASDWISPKSLYSKCIPKNLRVMSAGCAF